MINKQQKNYIENHKNTQQSIIKTSVCVVHDSKSTIL